MKIQFADVLTSTWRQLYWNIQFTLHCQLLPDVHCAWSRTIRQWALRPVRLWCTRLCAGRDSWGYTRGSPDSILCSWSSPKWASRLRCCHTTSHLLQALISGPACANMRIDRLVKCFNEALEAIYINLCNDLAENYTDGCILLKQEALQAFTGFSFILIQWK